MKRYVIPLGALALLLLIMSGAEAYTTTTTNNAQCSSGSVLGTTQYIEDISFYAATGARCAPYCASVNAACCTEKKYEFDDSQNPEPMSYMQYDCTAYSGTGTTAKASTYTWSPPPGSGYYRTYSTSWSATLLSYVAAPTATLNANPTTISTGQSSLLTWSSTGSTSCTGTGFSTGGATSGSVTVSPTVTTTYSVSCTNGSQSATSPVTVTIENHLTVSCTATPSSAELFGPVMWSADISGSNGPFVYAWSGSDGLSGSTAYVFKSYSSIGNKTARVSVTVPSTGGTGGTQTTTTGVTLGYGQCSGGTLVTQTGEGEDIDMVPLSIPYVEDQCSAITAQGQCCDVTVSYPANAQQTTFTYKVYSGATVSTNVTKTCTPAGADCEFLAGIATSNTTTTGGSGGTPAQTVSTACALPVHAVFPLECQTPTCDCTGPGCEVIVEEGDDTDLSANTPILYSGLNETGNTATFQGTVTNLGNNTVSAPFQNRFQVDIGNNGSYDFNLDVPSDSYVVPTSGSVTAISPPWTNLPAGTHAVRFCADLPPAGVGIVSEVNENNNCSGDLVFAVGASPLTMSITASPTRVKKGNTSVITWDATNVTSCTVTGTGLSSSGLSGSQSVVINRDTTFTLACIRGGVTFKSTVNVRLVPSFEEI